VSDPELQLQLQDVSKSFGGVQAVTRVSVDVQRGEMLSIIGPNGAGKTTLLNMISGFYHPDTGKIFLDGGDVSHAAPSKIAELGVARTFQNIALFRGMTVLDNLMLGRHVHMRSGVVSSFVYWGLAQREEVAHRRRVEDIIDFLKVQDLRKRPTGSLPYGLQKRVELGRALAAAGPPVVAVALRAPWDADALPELGTVVATYGIQPPQLAAAAAVIVDGAGLSGRLPVRVASAS